MYIQGNENSVVNTMGWIFTHSGLAIAEPITEDNSNIKIIRYSEDEKEFAELKRIAKENHYLLVRGINRNGNDTYFGYFP